MATLTQHRKLARKLILTGFGILFVGLILLFGLENYLPQWLMNLLIPGVPIVFVALTFMGLWLQIDHKKHRG